MWEPNDYYERLKKRAELIPDEKIREKTFRRIEALRQAEESHCIGDFIGIEIEIEEAFNSFNLLKNK